MALLENICKLPMGVNACVLIKLARTLLANHAYFYNDTGSFKQVF